MNEKLVKAVINQLGDEEYLKDVANHGASGGYSGFIYYSDTIEFFKKNRKLIVDLVNEMSNEFGQSPIQFVLSFNIFENYKPEELEPEIARALYGRLSKDDVLVPNALAWFALEEVARYKTDN